MVKVLPLPGNPTIFQSFLIASSPPYSSRTHRSTDSASFQSFLIASVNAFDNPSEYLFDITNTTFSLFLLLHDIQDVIDFCRRYDVDDFQSFLIASELEEKIREIDAETERKVFQSFLIASIGEDNSEGVDRSLSVFSYCFVGSL